MDKLGIEPVQLLTQVINFLILLIILQKLLYKPVIKMLDERRKKIEEGLRAAQNAKVEEEKNEKKRQEILSKSREEGKKIVTDAKAAAKKVEADIIAKAHAEAASVVERAKKDIENERVQMKKELQSETVEIASSIVERLLTDVLDDAAQKNIIEKKIRALTAKQ